jgi:hypothetical protein
MPVSLRLSWATRSTDSRVVLALVAAFGAFALGLGLSIASRDHAAFLPYWCSAVATACTIAIDFPGTGHPRWSELELSLPIAPLVRARAQLLLSLAVWILPSLAAFALSQLGPVGVGKLPLSDALLALANATASVIFAAAVRHSLALRRSLGSDALRFTTALVVLIAAAARSPAFGVVVLVLASPLLAIAHRAASRAPELLLPADASSAVSVRVDPPRPDPLDRRDVQTIRAEAEPALDVDAEHESTLGRVALRYSAGNAYALMLLVIVGLGALGINSGWLPLAASQTMLLATLVVSYAMWSTRLLRLDYLPYPRQRLFRFVAWPALAAIVLGIGLSMVLPAPDQLLRPRARDGVSTLSSPPSAWQLTGAEPPLITAPNGESHRPLEHSVGLGARLVAYDPYEIPRDASLTFQTYQLGRLLRDQRGITLTPEHIQRRFAAGPGGYQALSSDRFPELRDPAGLRGRLVGATVLLITALVALHIVIRPGAAINPNRLRRNLPYVTFFGLFVATQLYQMFAERWKDGTDLIAIVLGRMGRPLAENALIVLPVAAAICLLLYRSLTARFAQMEPPLRAKNMDTWFIEI